MQPDPLTERVWHWLPARPDRRRVTTPWVCAADLGIPETVAARILADLRRHGRAALNRSGQIYRGMPPTPEPPPDTQETLC